ncbi:MAG: hypothetical protein ACRCTQ_06805 [Brevinemataceae bacterium]
MKKRIIVIALLIMSCSFRDFNTNPLLEADFPPSQPTNSEISILSPNPDTLQVTDFLTLSAKLQDPYGISEINISTPELTKKFTINNNTKFYILNDTFGISNKNGYPDAQNKYPVTIEFKNVKNQTIRKTVEFHLTVASTYTKITIPTKPPIGSSWFSAEIIIELLSTGAPVKSIKIFNSLTDIHNEPINGSKIYTIPISTFIGSPVSSDTIFFQIEITSVHDITDTTPFSL